MNYCGIFYKDKDGYEILCQLDIQMLVYSGPREAQVGLKKFKEELNNRLNPKIEYKVVSRTWYGKPKVLEPVRQYMDEWVRSDLIQKLNTAFVKAIKIA